ncbi:MAG TPA: DUF1858 domain-containing protein, partial [Humisphaera sp.]
MTALNVLPTVPLPPARPVAGPDDIGPDTMIPALLARFPAARAVLDRYGLRGCGGRTGPAEPLRFFARTHGVDEPTLLRELADAASAPATVAAPRHGRSLRVVDSAVVDNAVADTIYRRYFAAGIVVILTAGATWGAWLLWRIGVGGHFTGAGLQEVNAHGHAQIYGWVGLFVMGFAYQALPRVWHTTLAHPRLAVAAFVAMLAGLVVRTAGMTTHDLWAGAIPAAVVGGLLELAAAAILAVQIVLTFRRSLAKLEPYVGFVFVAVGWFVLQAVMDVWHTYTTMSAATQKELLWYVATYQAPLRDLQIHGLAMSMILGVSLRMFPGIFGLPAVRARRAWAALAVLTASVVGECVLFVAYRWSANHVLAAFLLVPWLGLIVAAAMVALPWRLWRPTPEGGRSAKFVRAAYAWLAVSLVMLLLLPAYMKLTGIPFSHAYYGATRHAITVGFVSLMIMGMAAKAVPTLNGVDPRTLPALWGPFLLVNVGCFLRVTTQTLTDVHPGFFAVVGVSGTLEVIGLAWWGVGLLRVMLEGRRAAAESAAAAPTSTKPERVTPDHVVADVLAWFPATAEVFDRRGFTPLRNMVMRRTIARAVTVRQAATVRGIDP